MEGLVEPHRVIVGLDVPDSRPGGEVDVTTDGLSVIVEPQPPRLSRQRDDEALDLPKPCVPAVHNIVTIHVPNVIPPRRRRNGPMGYQLSLSHNRSWLACCSDAGVCAARS
jgi:hypothetical protein